MPSDYHRAATSCNIAAVCCRSPARKQASVALSLLPPVRSQRETTMLQLYFSPMACSLASRIALMEAGIEARYHPVHLRTKKVMEDDGDFRGVSAKGAVPVLVLDN